MSVGKTDELCDEQSEFRVAYQGCAACLGEGAPFEEFDPEFRQILDFWYRTGPDYGSVLLGRGLINDPYICQSGTDSTNLQDHISDNRRVDSAEQRLLCETYQQPHRR